MSLHSPLHNRLVLANDLSDFFLFPPPSLSSSSPSQADLISVSQSSIFVILHQHNQFVQSSANFELLRSLSTHFLTTTRAGHSHLTYIRFSVRKLHLQLRIVQEAEIDIRYGQQVMAPGKNVTRFDFAKSTFIAPYTTGLTGVNLR